MDMVSVRYSKFTGSLLDLPPLSQRGRNQRVVSSVKSLMKVQLEGLQCIWGLTAAQARRELAVPL